MTFELSIGGEMALSGDDFTRIEFASAWPDFAGRSSVRCDSGRSALLLAVDHWRFVGHRPSVVWLPNYLCPSVALILRRCGLQIRTYDDSLGKIGQFIPPKPQSDDLVVIVHYFGEQNRRALDFAAGRRGWGLIEDCVQSAYTSGVGVSGDYAVTSLRKWWPVPDGATLHLDDANWKPSLMTPDEGFVSRRVLAKMLREGDQSAEERHLELVAASEARLDANSGFAREPSWVSQTLLASSDVSKMIERRCANYETLIKRLGKLTRKNVRLVRVCDDLSSGKVPFALPLKLPSEMRDPLRRWLAARRIFCPIHWKLGVDAPQATANLAAGMLSLPLDQRYEVQHMEHLAQAISTFFEGT